MEYSVMKPSQKKRKIRCSDDKDDTGKAGSPSEEI
jgi:hypothetical protein